MIFAYVNRVNKFIGIDATKEEQAEILEALGCKMGEGYVIPPSFRGDLLCEADIAASFQKSVVDTLVEKAVRAAKEYHMDKLAIAGGVASNGSLRDAMRVACEKENITFYYPSPIYCTDNAAMIGVAAYYEYLRGTRHGLDLNAVPNLKLGER